MSNITHGLFARCLAQLKASMENPERSRFIFIIGPSGVGKTTLRREVLRKLCGDPLLWGTGQIPAIETFALLPHKAYFNSNWLSRTFVQELFSPSVEWLRDSDNGENVTYRAVKSAIDRSGADTLAASLPRGTEPDMWNHFKRLAPQRKVNFATIDQAHALCTNHRNKNPADHILNLMSILDTTGINMILSGVHGTAELWASRPEVRRRSDVIWMSPYSMDRPEDRQSFMVLLKTLGSRYTFSKPDLLAGMFCDLMAVSAGIFGVLRKILIDAKRRADLSGRSAITKQDIVDSFYGERDYQKLWEDVHFYNYAMRAADYKATSKEVARSWGITKKTTPRKDATGDASKGGA